MFKHFLQIIFEYWFLFLLFSYLAFFVGSVRVRISASIKKYLLNQYAFWVISLSGLSVVLYFVFEFVFGVESKILDLGNYFQFVTLFFAVFGGYYAYAQLNHSRYQSLVEDGHEAIQQRHYKKAIRYYEDACKLKKEFEVFSNFVEANIIVGNDAKAREQIKELQQLQEEDDEVIISLYLKVLLNCLKNNIVEARRVVIDLLNLCKNNPVAYRTMSWNFRDIENSRVLSTVSGEASEILLDLITYLGKPDKDQKENIENKYLNYGNIDF